MMVKIDLNLSPATFCKPSLIKVIPYRNIPKAPISEIKSKNVYSTAIKLELR